MHARSPMQCSPAAGLTLRAGLALCGVSAGVFLGACSGTGASLLGSKGETLRPEAFATTGPADTTVAPSAPAKPRPASDAPRDAVAMPVVSIGSIPAPTAVAPAAASAPPNSPAPSMPPPAITTSAGPPPTPPSSAAPIAETVIIDSLVGQINGRPVFASEIMEPLDGKLRALGESSRSASAWRTKAAEEIVAELRRRIEDELILAEARRSLTPEQRQGLFRFLRQVQETMVSQRSGSEVAADQQIQQETGRTLRQQSQDELDKELIRTELQRRVWSRVVVSWRDVQNEYERQQAKYNPPAEYLFRMAYVPADKADAAEKIQAAITAGQPFSEVAALEANEFNRKEGGQILRTAQGAQSEGEFSPVPEINGALQRVGVGQVLGPITYAPDPKKPDAKRTAWVYLEKIDRPEGVSLYDAQLELEQGLLSARRTTEAKRYFSGLFNRGNISGIEVMADRLMSIATARYAKRFANK